PLPPLPASASEDAAIASLAADGGAEPDWTVVRIKPGQSLSDVFREQGLSPAVLQTTLDAQSDATALRRIRPGDEFLFDIDASGNLRALRFDRNDAERVTLRFSGDTVTETIQDRALERRVDVAHGVIT